MQEVHWAPTSTGAFAAGRTLVRRSVAVARVQGVSSRPASMISVSITMASTKIAMMPAMIWSLLFAC
jgi:hypothetical protein